MSPTSCSEVAERSPISRRTITDRSPTSFNDSHAPILTKLVGDWSGTGRQLRRDLSATKSVAVRFLCMLKNLAATDLVAASSRTSRRLLCNLAGTDRGPCCDLCNRWKLSVAERSQSGCSVCLTGVNPTKYLWRWEPNRRSTTFFMQAACTCMYKWNVVKPPINQPTIRSAVNSFIMENMFKVYA